MITIVALYRYSLSHSAKTNANYVWLNLSTAQNQILNIMESIIFMIGLTLGKKAATKCHSKEEILIFNRSLTVFSGIVRQYGLNFSWRKMIWLGSVSFSWTLAFLCFVMRQLVVALVHAYPLYLLFLATLRC
jgi:hypothetical protein